MSVRERIKVKATWTIDKFYDPDGKIAQLLKRGRRTRLGWVAYILTLGRRDIRQGVTIEEVIEKFGNHIGRKRIKGNVFLNSGIGEIWDLVTGTSANHFDNANSQLGVGDGTTAEDPTQTDLQGVSTAYVGMDTGYPSRTAQTLSFRSTFDGATANFAWEECVVKHAVSAICINRKVQSMGTKASGTTWVLTLDLTIS